MKNKLSVREIASVLLIIIFILISGCSIKINDQKNNKPETTETSGNNKNKSISGIQLHFIDVGQADSILVQQGNSAMLIDAGNNDDYDKVRDYLKDKKIEYLDYLIGTHPHEDHIGGLDGVIKDFNIGKIYMPKVTKPTKTFEDVINAIRAKEMKISTPVPGSEFMLGEALCTILAPNGKEYKDENNYSIVIKIKYKEESFLLTGDAEGISEKEIMSKNFNISADVLKLGHHGSNSSTTKAFLDKVKPKYAVLCVSKGNDYKHPHKTTMDKLKSRGIKLYRTDEGGTIVCTSDGNSISFDVKAGSYSYGGK